MTRIFKYTSNTLPQNLKNQIITFLCVQWPEGFTGKNANRDYVIKEEYHPQHFLLIEDDVVVSYVGVVWKILSHQGLNYKTYGLSGVYTKPEFRNKGYGLQLVKEAKKYIEESDGDIALFPSVLKDFYEKTGFIRLDNAKILKGDSNKPVFVNESVYMLFVSDKGKKRKKDFETIPIYFGKSTW